ncbi:hypothetical protein GLAREA_05094 [Glarea lozoyensis ATCC 20868]|uniref:TRIP4/RQT4 C2HC5-type zinc finger domain-containing protein n=1 Tax=Glarea lozoyensis (strain ATCC 20868 / MF5171) TaxID=1116229 RepID=S3DUZ7_GLAL2|nr:uncharacterized protein GLAREA_05094 [Glarea lozoyensis ATCC 20868]EPE35756.1 hypothetical protein GLAREA_05094 [Glarea lozoyensis ATCC 20868]
MSLAQLEHLLPLPKPDLQQVLDYAATLSKQQAIEHFKDLLGVSPQAIEFISSFNSRRKDPTAPAISQPSSSAPSPSNDNGVPRTSRKQPKKKAPLHTPAARKIEDTYAAQGHAYKKKDEDDYITKRPAPANAAPKNAFTLNTKPDLIAAPTPKPPPSAAGTLISDFKSSSNNSSRNASRTGSPAPTQKKTKVNITGGTSMHGASTVVSELDAVIRSLEVSTNSSLLPSVEKRRCNCIGARHPLLTAAPNCLNCGKVICVKEGLGPCTFCGNPLLSAVEVQGMIKELREERGKEKMAQDAAGHKRAEISKKPAPFSQPRPVDLSPAEQKAKEHRDRLLGFQAQNAKRTTVRDEAADFETPMTAGANIWASPAERARQLKKQQKVLAEQEWNARPEYDKRRQVVSIDVAKGKVMRKMAAVERPQQVESESEEEVEEPVLQPVSGNGGGGKFSRNPLLGGMIKPVWSAKGKEVEGEEVTRKKMWRRVQDDLDDNEAVILDGGAYGGTGREGNGY